MKPFYGLTKGVLTFVLTLFYRHKTFGRENYIEGPALIAANHASYLDPELLCVSCPGELYFLARKELFQKAFFRWLITHLNAVPIYGTTEDLNTFKTVLQLLEQGKKVVIFPEGNRSFNGALGNFKRGVALIALHAKAPIIPVYIHGSFEAWPRTRKYPRIFAKTACRIGKPIYGQSFSSLKRRKAQEEMTLALEQSLKGLKDNLTTDEHR